MHWEQNLGALFIYFCISVNNHAEGTVSGSEPESALAAHCRLTLPSRSTDRTGSHHSQGIWTNQDS